VVVILSGSKKSFLRTPIPFSSSSVLFVPFPLF
jgi:hypothetical protein